MKTLVDIFSRFWRIVPDSHANLATRFWASEESRNRYRAQTIGISGAILMLTFIIVDLIRWSADTLPFTMISLVIFGIHTILAFNRQEPIKKLSIYPFIGGSFIIAIIGTCFAAVRLGEMVQLVTGFFLVSVAILLVPSFTLSFFITAMILAISHIIALRLMLPATTQLWDAQIYIIFLVSPVIIPLMAHMGIKQRWETFLSQQAIQEFNLQLQVQKVALEKANQLLEKRNEELDAFAHTVAHDLKNPLTIVVGYAEVVRDDMVEDEDLRWLEYIDHVIAAGRKGNTIVQELLLLAAVRKEDVALTRLDMGLIVGQSLERLSHHLERENVDLIQPAHWPTAVGYAGWVEEVWVNYISNAIKYGGRPCHMELVAEVMPQGWARFGVRDNGPGLSLEEQAVLFTEFTRLNVSRAEGHGLGLSIVQRIMDKLNGRVSIESEVGQGSTFYFDLPAGVEGSSEFQIKDHTDSAE
jgi:signal transduction histidine kinase